MTLPGCGSGAGAEQCVLAVTACLSLFVTSQGCWQLLSAGCLALAGRTVIALCPRVQRASKPSPQCSVQVKAHADNVTAMFGYEFEHYLKGSLTALCKLNNASRPALYEKCQEITFGAI